VTHDPRDRVQVLRNGRHVAWARAAATIVVASHDGPVSVRGTLSALSAAGVAIGDDGKATVEWADVTAIVGVDVSPASLAPRRSGSRVPEADRKRPTVATLLRLTPGAVGRLDAAATRAGLSRSAFVEKWANEQG